MEVKKLKYLNKKDRKLFDAGCKAGEQKNFKYAIDMLRNLLKHEPGVLEVRQKLREIELQRIGGEVSAFRQFLAPILKFPNLAKGPALVNQKKYSEALDNAEAAMAFDPTAIPCAKLLATAAEAADLLVISKMTYEMLHEHHPDNTQVLEALADTYGKLGMGTEEIECRGKLRKMDPKNEAYATALDEAEDIASEDRRDPEDTGYDALGGSTGSEPSEKEKEVLAKQIKMQENIVNRNNSADNRKKLGDLYAIANDYEQALENYNIAVEQASAMDSALDAAITRVTAQQYNAGIREWQVYLDGGGLSAEEIQEAKEQIINLSSERAEMLIGRAKERVQRQPHATNERFNLARLLWKYENFDEAIANLEQTKSNTQYRNISLLFLGKCLLAKRQHAKAIEHIESAIAAMKRMDMTRKNAYYTLAKCHKLAGNEEAERACYSKIYAVDESYKDVAEIMEGHYKKQLMSEY